MTRLRELLLTRLECQCFRAEIEYKLKFRMVSRREACLFLCSRNRGGSEKRRRFTVEACDRRVRRRGRSKLLSTLTISSTFSLLSTLKSRRFIVRLFLLLETLVILLSRQIDCAKRRVSGDLIDLSLEYTNKKSVFANFYLTVINNFDK